MRGIALIKHGRRELYAVKQSDIVLDSERNTIEFDSGEYINSNGDKTHDRHILNMEKTEVTLL